jgi:hypothetical protein
MMEREAMGGFQWTANELSRISGKKYSRQSVQGLWGRRNNNGFPELHPHTINGRDHDYFHFDEIREWYKAHHGAAHA